jgi:RNA polymerase-interacting CarD/CdnL/TRCF family regulator
MRGMIKYGDLLDGSLTIMDLARMNESIDCQNENERRMMEASRHG